jgi:molybdopterin-guanine dinucleotide biosynthesis protein B
MKVIGLAGWSGAGKTTLLVKLIPLLRARGLTVSTLKHAHHAFDLDQPGKDSFEHRMAGASEVLIASARRFALMHELRDEQEPSLAELLPRLSPVDLVLVEGFKREAHPKVEIHRSANKKPFLFGSVPNVVAVIADVPVPNFGGSVCDLNDRNAAADMLVACARPLDQVLGLLGHSDTIS